MIKETKVIIDQTTKSLLDSITREISNGIGMALEGLNISECIEEVNSNINNHLEAVINVLKSGGSNWLKK